MVRDPELGPKGAGGEVRSADPPRGSSACSPADETPTTCAIGPYTTGNPPSRPVVSLQPIPVPTGMGREGRPVVLDGRLIMRLDDPEHGLLVGKWFVEAGFGSWHQLQEALSDSPYDVAEAVAGIAGPAIE